MNKEEKETNECQECEVKNDKVDDKESIDKQNIEILKEQLEKATKEKDEWMNKYYSQYADIQNLRKQIAKDNEVLIKFAGEPFLKSIIPFMISMEQSFKYEPQDDPKAQGWIKGIHLSYKQLLSALEKEGVKIIEPKEGDKFDPTYMEAVATYEAEKPDIVRNVFMKGYMLKDRLVYPANVEVSVVKKDDAKKDNNENK